MNEHLIPENPPRVVVGHPPRYQANEETRMWGRRIRALRVFLALVFLAALCVGMVAYARYRHAEAVEINANQY